MALPDTEGMPSTVSAYVEEIHRACLNQADTFPPAVRESEPQRPLSAILREHALGQR